MTVKIQTATGKGPAISFTGYRLSLPETERKAVGSAALAMKSAILRGSPARLRGVGKSGARLNVRYDVKSPGGDPIAVVKAIGPWQLIEGNTRPHLIASKKAGSRARRAGLESGLFVRAPGRRLRPTGRGRQGAILTPQGPRAYARHPGTRGKHPWAKGVERGTPAATLAFAKIVRADLHRQFG